MTRTGGDIFYKVSSTCSAVSDLEFFSRLGSSGRNLTFATHARHGTAKTSCTAGNDLGDHRGSLTGAIREPEFAACTRWSCCENNAAFQRSECADAVAARETLHLNG